MATWYPIEGWYPKNTPLVDLRQPGPIRASTLHKAFRVDGNIDPDNGSPPQATPFQWQWI